MTTTGPVRRWPPSGASRGLAGAVRRTDLDAGYDRSRAGSGPISSRKRTDLDAGYDRSR
ncbi:hypothetical protein HMPREF1318_2020 [Actinomyces massiliensis F0489]|uniref:Uncharacterized protein n=1 Tax=Actinomyces massiliensis F0489 TaxID=1125718 RepID=J0XC63_9ACTO|nr:hypothetical protein HMPREF1318_2020 [Actinomyces massiliensis F0489]